MNDALRANDELATNLDIGFDSLEFNTADVIDHAHEALRKYNYTRVNGIEIATPDNVEYIYNHGKTLAVIAYLTIYGDANAQTPITNYWTGELDYMDDNTSQFAIVLSESEECPGVLQTDVVQITRDYYDHNVYAYAHDWASSEFEDRLFAYLKDLYGDLDDTRKAFKELQQQYATIEKNLQATHTQLLNELKGL